MGGVNPTGPDGTVPCPGHGTQPSVQDHTSPSDDDTPSPPHAGAASSDGTSDITEKVATSQDDATRPSSTDGVDQCASETPLEGTTCPSSTDGVDQDATEAPLEGATRPSSTEGGDQGATAAPPEGTTDCERTVYTDVDFDIVQRILGTIFGQCAGDAIGLLTEFLTKDESKMYYKSVAKKLEYHHKQIACDGHRTRWEVGDWTDDSDQMILILLSIIENKGKVDPLDFGRRIKTWARKGFPELGDHVGMGQGRTTATVICKLDYVKDPHATADLVWRATGKQRAANGAVMRTSILGVHRYPDIDTVVQNAITIAKTTHADPRCQASTVAVSVAIATMLQRNPRHVAKKGKYDVKAIIRDCYDQASKCLETPEEKMELDTYLTCKKLKDLKLDEAGMIGYTYKSMGTGFWALKQDNFRDTITKIVMEGGDADTNACVAGAMLGCKRGLTSIPGSWREKLKHKDWLEAIIDRYFQMMFEVYKVDFRRFSSRDKT